MSAVQAGLTGLTAFQRRQSVRAEDVFEAMLNESERTAEVLASAIEDDDLLAEVFERAVEAGAKSAFESKRRLLGRVVAAAVNGTGFATPDRYLLLVKAIDAIEPAHVQLLVLLATPTPGEGVNAGGESEGWSPPEDILRRWPEVEEVLEPLLAGLANSGLTDSRGTFGGLQAYAPSKHGRLLLKHLVREDLRTTTDLGAAAIVGRIQPSPDWRIITRNLGPGVAQRVRISVTKDMGNATEIVAEEEGIDLGPFDESVTIIRAPLKGSEPPYSFHVRWVDSRGDRVHETLIDQARG